MATKMMTDLKELQELEFALIDLNLYLDTHPNDDEAMMKKATYMETLMELSTKYQENHTPLLARNIKTNEDQNKWLNDPWPWENQERRA
ncbi:MAG: spore coat protein CotJB [Clostridiaceae bacterium]